MAMSFSEDFDNCGVVLSFCHLTPTSSMLCSLAISRNHKHPRSRFERSHTTISDCSFFISTAIKAHQKASDDVRRLQQQQEENNENIQSLSDSLDRQRCPKQREISKKYIRKQKMTRTKIMKDVKETLKVEKRAIYVMEEAEAMWKFEAMCSGEA
ncbi:hypothetical protein B9Z55_026740 [Caenorhabditis nigoni]|uniref:Uncharacterized protein n=1 Tax=Caenorhabditis nigoni TaxID=1611254 RepID=A0A2G5SH63_9PELO|nr:hypothetical protein B9Z55_026740 [Caenorhabditis nigoni]